MRGVHVWARHRVCSAGRDDSRLETSRTLPPHVIASRRKASFLPRHPLPSPRALSPLPHLANPPSPLLSPSTSLAVSRDLVVAADSSHGLDTTSRSKRAPPTHARAEHAPPPTKDVAYVRSVRDARVTVPLRGHSGNLALVAISGARVVGRRSAACPASCPKPTLLRPPLRVLTLSLDQPPPRPSSPFSTIPHPPSTQTT